MEATVVVVTLRESQGVVGVWACARACVRMCARACVRVRVRAGARPSLRKGI